MNRPTSGDQKTAFRLDIQGLRAVAVGAVLLYHAGVPFLPGGYVGVDVFFVISGFLITSHLVSALSTAGRVRFADFYARRARRILPASFLVLILSLVAALIWYPPLLLGEVWRGAIATALYVPNVLFAVNGTDYLSESTPSLFQHYWSLGVEEQFYLVWPLLLAFLWPLARNPRLLLVVVAALVGISFIACVYLTFRSQPLAFFLLPTRAWELGLGGLVALILQRQPTPLPPRFAAPVGWLGLVAIVICVLGFDSSTPFPGYWAAAPAVATSMVILGGATRSKWGPGGALSLRGMVFVGTISYSLYLVHWPALIIPQTVVGFDNPLPLWITLLIAAACVPVAWLMYVLVENPMRSARFLVSARPRRSLLGALAMSLATVVIATGAYAVSRTAPLHAGVPAAQTVISSPPTDTPYVPSNLIPSLREAENDQATLYEDGCHRSFDSVDSSGCLFGDAHRPRIALFGDSHAAQWFPALWAFANSEGYSLETFTKSSCPSISANVVRNGVPYSECDTWRDAVIDRLNEEQPTAVIISNYGSADFGGSSDTYAASWQEALGETLDRLASPAVVIADTPDMGATPAVCLSGSLNDALACAKPRSVALASPSRQAEVDATSTRSVPLIDLTDVICGPEVCSPIIGRNLAYRDAHHLTATFSTLLTDTLAAELLPILDGGRD